MPDWSYQTLIRPVLLRLPTIAARDVVFGALGAICSNPIGRILLGSIGRSRPSKHIQASVLGMDFPSPVGIGAGLDVRCRALNALPALGVGFIEIGPVTTMPIRDDEWIVVRDNDLALEYNDLPHNIGGNEVRRKLLARSKDDVRIGVRLANSPGSSLEQAAAELQELIDLFSQTADYLVIDTRWGPASVESDDQTRAAFVTIIAEIARQLRNVKPLFITISPDLTDSQVTKLVEYSIAAGFRGIVVTGGAEMAEKHRLTGRPTYTRSVGLVSFLRLRWPMLTIIGSGGLIEPRDALDMLNSGANLVQLHSGFFFSGPGLPQRINESATAYNVVRLQVEDTSSHARVPGPGWLWLSIFATMLIASGAYVVFLQFGHPPIDSDQLFLKVSKSAMHHMSSHVMKFLHMNRATAGGLLFGLGAQMLTLAVAGQRKGQKWATQTLLAISVPLLYLLYSLLDSTALKSMLWIEIGFAAAFIFLAGRVNHALAPRSWNLRNDLTWKLSLYGQLCLVLLSLLLLFFGENYISSAMTQTLTSSDTTFLHMTPKVIEASNKNLMQLLASTKMTVGIAISASALLLLATTLWGLKQSERYIWLSVLIAGVLGFSAYFTAKSAFAFEPLLSIFSAPAVVAVLLLIGGLGLTATAAFRPPGRI